MDERTIFQPSAFGSVRPGTRLNGVYEIEKPVAQGGMGEVYRGFNIQTRDIVAIKMIRPEFSANPEVMELFRREASILHHLVHEAIVRYFVFSVDPDIQRAYLAMEFVDGPSLTNRLASGPLPLAEVRVLQKRIASALGAAHRLGVVHRDVSPDNIILPDGDVNRATIIDFGIARSLRVGAGTVIGSGFAGKYNYVSPEQLGLAGGDVTFRSDIYSFGLVLAEALRGKPIDMNGSQAEIIEKRRVIPDLSDLDKSIRPLIQAMLQPLPDKRPASMAAVAAWGEDKRSGGASGRANGGDAPPARESGGGRVAALVGALIAIVSLGGAAYVFRDDLADWVPAPGTPSAPAPPARPSTPAPAPPSEASTATQLPPLGPKEAIGAAPTPSAAETPPAVENQIAALQPEAEPGPPPSAGPSPSPAPPPPAANPQNQQVPTAEAILEAMPPHASQALVDLPPATVGAPYRAELPEFTDHGGKGLRLQVDSAPEGMTFTDLGDGRSAVEGAPKHAGSAQMHVVATDRNGRTAETTATIVVADKAPPPASTALAQAAGDHSPGTAAPTSAAPPPVKQEARLEPPRPSLSNAVLGGAKVGESFSADLPPFSGGGAANSLRLRIDPRLPEGLGFTDLGSGKSHISGKPSAPGDFAFDVVAMNGSGLTGRMSIKLPVAPSPAPPPASPSVDHERLFVQGYAGGDCFFIKPLSGGAHAYLGVGAELKPFERFEAAFKTEVGAEPQLSLRLITSAECPALDLLRPGVGQTADAPRIELADYRVGRNKPLAGTIANLGGRRVTLILVDNAGAAYRLEAKPQAGGDSATFSIPLTPDAASIGPIQVILAIVSMKPIPALESFRSGPLKTIAPTLFEEARAGSASVGAEFFTFGN